MPSLGVLRTQLSRFLFPALVLVLSAAVAVFFVNDHRQQQRQQAQAQVQRILEQQRTELLKSVNSVMYLATGVVAYIQANNGYLPTEQAISWMHSLQRYNPYIRNIGLAPDNRIRFIYPLEGNEQALGLHYSDLASQWPRVKQAMDTHRPVMDGPVQLVQGGLGLIHRAPVYLRNGRYWGVVSTVMRLDRILADITAQAARGGVALQFHATPYAGDLRSPGVLVLNLPLEGMTWQLSGHLLQPAEAGTDYPVLLAWAMVLLLTLIAWRLSDSAWQQRQLQVSLTQSLRLFQVAFQHMPHGVLILDKEGRIVEANPVIQQLLRHPGINAHGLQFVSLISASQRQAAVHLLSVAQGGEPVTGESELAGVTPDAAVPVELSAVGLHHEQLGCLVFVRDIRDSRRLQQAQNEFISTASHELRTPLTSIICALELIRSGTLGALPGDVDGILAMAMTNSDRLQKLINDLLDTNRLILGHLTLDIAPLDAEAVASRVIASLQPMAAPTGVTLHLEVAGQPRVLADADKLTQVLVNLLANAIRFSWQNGRVMVRVEAMFESVRFSVQDFGRGIDPAFASRAFTRFGQADSSDSREQGGTGLGLFICKGLVEHMQGRIGYDSSPGQGATFWFELPRVPA